MPPSHRAIQWSPMNCTTGSMGFNKTVRRSHRCCSAGKWNGVNLIENCSTDPSRHRRPYQTGTKENPIPDSCPQKISLQLMQRIPVEDDTRDVFFTDDLAFQFFTEWHWSSGCTASVIKPSGVDEFENKFLQFRNQLRFPFRKWKMNSGFFLSHTQYKSDFKSKSNSLVFLLNLRSPDPPYWPPLHCMKFCLFVYLQRTFKK